MLCLSRRQVFFTKNGRHLGDAFVDSYVKLRRAHWAEYAGTVTPWERAQYLDV